MSHNGSVIQINTAPIYAGSPFINLLKNGQEWLHIEGSQPPIPSSLNEDGYPISISNGGVYSALYEMAPQSVLPGNYKCRWIGEGTISTFVMEGGTVIDGSKTGVNGWFTCRPTTTTGFIGISAINPANPITQLEFYYEDYEELLDAGQVFTPRYLDLMQYSGLTRFLNAMQGNGPIYSKWSHRRPTSYFNWASPEIRPSMYRGVATKVGNDYQLDLGDGGNPQERDMHFLRFDADGDAGSTLNGRPLLFLTGEFLAYSELYPQDNKNFIVTYDEAGGGWIMSPNLLGNGWPPEIMWQLCKEVGSHNWPTFPYLGLDAATPSGTTDYVTEYTTTFRQWCSDNDCEWMLSFNEPSNEVWNFGNGFYQTQYAQLSAARRWAPQSDVTISIASPGVVTWTAHGLSVNDPLWLSSTGALPTGLFQWEPYYVRTVESPNTFTIARHRTTDPEPGDAIDTSGSQSGTQHATKNIFALNDWYGRVGSIMAGQIDDVYEGDASKYNLICGVHTAASPSGSNGRLAGLYVSEDGGIPYRDWNPIVAPANYYNSTYYGTETEEEMAAAYAVADPAGKAQIAAEYAAGVILSGSMTISAVATRLSAWVVWADGLRCSPYEGHYSPDLGGDAEIDALRTASKFVPAMRDYERLMYSQCLQRGFMYPSLYRISGADAWGVWPTLYAEDTPPAWEAIVDTAYNPNPVLFTLRTSVA